MGFVPDNIILDSGPIVRLFRERVSYLVIPEFEFSELIGFVVASVSYKDIDLVQQQNEGLICDLIDSYKHVFSPNDLKQFEFALRELVRQLHEHFLHFGIYSYDGCSSPYHFKHLLPDGSIILEFDYTDPEINW